MKATIIRNIFNTYIWQKPLFSKYKHFDKTVGKSQIAQYNDKQKTSTGTS